MLDSFSILAAMSGIKGRDVVEAQKFLGLAELSAESRRPSGEGKDRLRKTLVIAAVIVLALGIVACTVYYTQWPQWLSRQFSASEEDRLAADSSGLSAYPGAETAPDETVSATAGGVTISARQTIVDNFFAMIILRVEGAELMDREGLMLGGISVAVGGEKFNMSAGFVEGSFDDGAMDYRILLSNHLEPGFFSGREIEISVSELGRGDLHGYAPIIQDSWELNWKLQASQEICTARPEIRLGAIGATLETVELSPVSLRLLWKTDGKWEGVETMERFQPYAAGIRLKDGSEQLLTFSHSAYEGYTDDESFLYEQRIMTANILKPEVVDALLFSDKWPWAQELTAADLYAVELGQGSTPGNR